MFFPRAFSCWLVLLALCFAVPAHAGGLIRDAEIESTLRRYANPVFRAAGLKPSAIHLYMVQDDSLNAFVAGGQNLFIHTGLILEMQNPAMLMGVMAHETGHIAGGHLAKGGEKLKDAQLGTIMATVLGAAAAVASGKPEAAAAVIGGASSSVTRNYLSFSRANENAADQAALGFLDKLRISASGMADVFTLLKRQERQHIGRPDPYMLTHPLSSERIENVQSHVKRSPIAPGSYPKEFDEGHARMLAKLYAFLKSPEQTLRRYPTTDRSIAARMARAIAYFMQAKSDAALEQMAGLIAEHPSDPFLYDLQGQIAFESAQIETAYQAYSKAAELAPKEPLILVDLAKVALARHTPQDITQALQLLDRALVMDRENGMAWHLQAIAYGKQGNDGMANLSLSEEALLAGDAKEALAQAGKALHQLAKGTPGHQRAEDLKQRAQQMRKEQKENASPF